VSTELRDQPFGPLVSVGRLSFANAAIEAVVAEIRFAGTKEILNSEDAIGILERLAPFGVTAVEPSEQRQIQVMLSAGANTVAGENTVISRGWRFVGSGCPYVFTVMPGMASIQASKYLRWSESLRPQFVELLGVVRDFCGARIMQRTGLRYINRISFPNGGRDWAGVVDLAVAGILSHEVLGELVQSAQQQVELKLHEGVGALLRHGPLPASDGASGYLIDIDVYDSISAELDVIHVIERAQRLNRTAFAIFNEMLTDDQRRRMNPVDEEGEE
jgi:uncharacterized protein (TIGR04255 family)